MELISIEDKAKGLKSDKYNVIIYVKEIDRFTNGMSKIQLTSIELVSGFDPSQFEWVKTSMKNKFKSIKKTSDIEWLESEDAIKKLRKDKLEKLKQTL